MTELYAPLRIIESGPSRWALVGELDMAGAPELAGQLAGCDGDVVLDCSGLTFVDASGLDVFVRIRTACESRGVRFALVKPSRCLLRLLKITGMEELLPTRVDGPLE
jgi:anti-sigma B factor antagonist